MDCDLHHLPGVSCGEANTLPSEDLPRSQKKKKERVLAFTMIDVMRNRKYKALL